MIILPNSLILETEIALLRPLHANDFGPFLELARQDSSMWYYFTLNLADEASMQRWFESAFTEKSANTRRPFTIIDKRTGKIAGSSSFGNISGVDLRLEIGWSWLGPAFRGSGLNKHAKFAMMRYAFDELNLERVEFKTDADNARARKGLENIGAIAEGVLRSHMTMWNSRRRSSVYYSVLKPEWPELKQTIFKDIK